MARSSQVCSVYLEYILGMHIRFSVMIVGTTSRPSPADLYVTLHASEDSDQYKQVTRNQDVTRYRGGRTSDMALKSRLLLSEAIRRRTQAQALPFFISRHYSPKIDTAYHWRALSTVRDRLKPPIHPIIPAKSEVDHPFFNYTSGRWL
jgi:hypothetical protein